MVPVGLAGYCFGSSPRQPSGWQHRAQRIRGEPQGLEHEGRWGGGCLLQGWRLASLLLPEGGQGLLGQRRPCSGSQRFQHLWKGGSQGLFGEARAQAVLHLCVGVPKIAYGHNPGLPYSPQETHLPEPSSQQLAWSWASPQELRPNNTFPHPPRALYVL